MRVEEGGVADGNLEDQLAHSLQVMEYQQMRAVEDSVKSLLEALRLPTTSQHFEETPERVAKMLLGFVRPVDLKSVLEEGFEEANESLMVTQCDIPFSGLCAHHLLPFWGDAAVAYLPKETIVGLSKLTRVVEAAGRIQPSTQEAITESVADAIWHHMRPAGVAVITRAVHGCMAVRGVRAPRTHTVVSAMRGLFRDAPSTKSEFMSIVEASWRG